MTTIKETLPILDRTKTAMIVVDMQNGFLDDEGSMVKTGMDITELKKTVVPVSRLVEACHRVDVPTIFTRMVQRADYKDAGLRLERRPILKEIGSLVAGTWDMELDPRMVVKPEDYILDKNRYSAFYNTNLEVILRGLAVDTLIICGVTTEICVESTIRDAYFRDYKVLVPEDAVAAMDVARHQGTLLTIQYGFGTVTRTAEVIDSLGVTVGAETHSH